MKIHGILLANLTVLAMNTAVLAESSHVLTSPGGVHTVELSLAQGELHARVKRG